MVKEYGGLTVTDKQHEKAVRRLDRMHKAYNKIDRARQTINSYWIEGQSDEELLVIRNELDEVLEQMEHWMEGEGKNGI